MGNPCLARDFLGLRVACRTWLLPCFDSGNGVRSAPWAARCLLLLAWCGREKPAATVRKMCIRMFRTVVLY